jgi:dihydrofolate reductase
MANCKVVAVEHMSLDGVYQAPGRSDEDSRGNFKHGGWSAPGDDPKLQQVISKYMTGGWSLVAGRTTYEHLYEAWHVRQPTHPMTQALTNVEKFVATRDRGYQLPWENSTLLAGDAGETVAKLKAAHDKTLVIFGSGVLVRSLMEHELIDELLLMIHPVVLGDGLRFFADAPFTKFALADELTTGTGVVVSTYQLAAG